MAKSYDKIFKESQDQIITAVVMTVLCIENFEQSEIVQLDLQKTLERDPDMLRRIRHFNPALDYILHIEIQTDDDPKMRERMLIYFALLWERFGIPIRQVVIYIGKKNVQR